VWRASASVASAAAFPIVLGELGVLLVLGERGCLLVLPGMDEESTCRNKLRTRPACLS
jgi:hypothetical protein